MARRRTTTSARPTVVPLSTREPERTEAEKYSEALANAARLSNAQAAARLQLRRDQFSVPSMPPGVGPKSGGLAQDSAIKGVATWASNQIAQDQAPAQFSIPAWPSGFGGSGLGYANGVGFMGFALLSELAQIPEYRVIFEVIASEMTREWIEFKSVGDEDANKKIDKAEKIKRLTDAVDRFKVRDVFRHVAEGDGSMGRGHLYVDTGDTDDRDELLKPIGNGHNKLSRAKVSKDRPVKAFRPVEAIWCYPNQYDSNDPLKADWYDPTYWFCMGKQVHRTRLLTFVGRPVPDILKPAYMFGGLSLSQLAKPYVDNWIRTRQAVSDLVWSFSVSGLKTNKQAFLDPTGTTLLNRIALFNNFRNNNGTMILDKDSEEWFNIVTPLAGLAELQASAQEHMSAVSRIPLVKLLGIQPQGLNASSEGEIRVFYDFIHGFQETLFRHNLTRVIDFIQLSEFGEVDSEISFEFKSLWKLDSAAQAAVDKTVADIHDVYASIGVVDPETIRKAVAADPNSPYAGLDLDAEPAPGEAEGFGGEEEDPLLHPMKPGDPTDKTTNRLESEATSFGSPETGGFADK